MLYIEAFRAGKTVKAEAYNRVADGRARIQMMWLLPGAVKGLGKLSPFATAVLQHLPPVYRVFKCLMRLRTTSLGSCASEL